MTASTIIILAHNGASFTARCLDSLLLSDPLPAAVIVVNNGSTDETASVLAARAADFAAAGVSYRICTNDRNVGCSEARNTAWALAETPYAVFLDNDTAVRTRSWLGTLAGILDADPSVGVVAPVMVYPWKPHLIQCAGVDLSPTGRIRFRGRGEPLSTPPFDQIAYPPALISACWMMRTNLLASTGGLDPLFHPVQYEDLDFCMQVREHGLRCACTPLAQTYHFEGTTTAADGKDAYVRTILANSAKFRARWHNRLQEMPPATGNWDWRDRNSFGMTTELDLHTRI